MRGTKFGQMHGATIPFEARVECDVMHFFRQGTPHTHFVREYALCVAGSGIVMIDGQAYRCGAGAGVLIPAGSQHAMIPDGGPLAFCMVIFYELESPS